VNVHFELNLQKSYQVVECQGPRFKVLNLGQVPHGSKHTHALAVEFLGKSITDSAPTAASYQSHLVIDIPGWVNNK